MKVPRFLLILAIVGLLALLVYTKQDPTNTRFRQFGPLLGIGFGAMTVWEFRQGATTFMFAPVERTKDPAGFWVAIALYAGMSATFFALPFLPQVWFQ